MDKLHDGPPRAGAPRSPHGAAHPSPSSMTTLQARRPSIRCRCARPPSAPQGGAGRPLTASAAHGYGGRYQLLATAAAAAGPVGWSLTISPIAAARADVSMHPCDPPLSSASASPGARLVDGGHARRSAHGRRALLLRARQHARAAPRGGRRARRDDRRQLARGGSSSGPRPAHTALGRLARRLDAAWPLSRRHAAAVPEAPSARALCARIVPSPPASIMPHHAASCRALLNGSAAHCRRDGRAGARFGHTGSSDVARPILPRGCAASRRAFYHGYGPHDC